MGKQAKKEEISNSNSSLLHSTLTEVIIELLDEETLEILKKKLMHTINIRYGDAIERHLRNDEKFRHLFEAALPTPFDDPKKSHDVSTSTDKNHMTELSTTPESTESYKVEQREKTKYSTAKNSLKQLRTKNIASNREKIKGCPPFKKLLPKVEKPKVIVQYSDNSVFLNQTNNTLLSEKYVASSFPNENEYFSTTSKNKDLIKNKENDSFLVNQMKRLSFIKPNQKNKENGVSTITDNKMEDLKNNFPPKKIRTIKHKPLVNRSEYEISKESAIPERRNFILPEVELIHKPQELTSFEKSAEIFEIKGNQMKKTSSKVLFSYINPQVTISIIDIPPVQAINSKKNIEIVNSQLDKSDEDMQNNSGSEANDVSTKRNGKVYTNFRKEETIKIITSYLGSTRKARENAMEEDNTNRLQKLLLNGTDVKKIEKIIPPSTCEQDGEKVKTIQIKHDCDLQNQSVLKQKYSDLKIKTKSENIPLENDSLPYSISLNKNVEETKEVTIQNHSVLNWFGQHETETEDASSKMDMNYSSEISISEDKNQKTGGVQDTNGKNNNRNRKSNASDDITRSEKGGKSISDVKDSNIQKQHSNIIENLTDNKEDKNNELSCKDFIKTVDEKETDTPSEPKNDIEYVTILSGNKEDKLEIINESSTTENDTLEHLSNEPKTHSETITEQDQKRNITFSQKTSMEDNGQTYLVKIIYKENNSNTSIEQIINEEQNFELKIDELYGEKEKELERVKTRKRKWEEIKDKDAGTKRYNLRSASSSEKVHKKKTRRLFRPTEMMTRSRLSH